MSLRRFAQTNNASTQSPARPTLPTTPRNKTTAPIDSYRSPAITPSISHTVPFDWSAVRGRKPPPYAAGTPLRNGGRKLQNGLNSTLNTPAKKVVRKQGLIEKISNIPSTIAFEIALFPHNVPLPSHKTSARLLAGAAHFLNLCMRIHNIRQAAKADPGWEDMYQEGEGQSWFNWTIPAGILLILASVLNVAYLFTRTTVYRMHKRLDPVASPNAHFVSSQLDFEPIVLPSITSRVLSGCAYAFSYSWRWLLNFQLPVRPGQQPGRTSRIQQLDVWTPGQFEKDLFVLYSPAHSILWLATGTSNWIAMFFIMGLVSAQLHALTYFYTTLVKDKEIIAAEVMNEYNNGFVYPRVNPIRRDVAVMTHQSEVVNVWED